MAAFLCRACGGILELIEGKPLCRCKFCNTIQSVPLLDSAEKAELCARAETLRREFRYDKAIALYEELIRLSPTDADLYWALTLCRYGAELSPDGSVSLNRIQAHSVLSDEDYKLALKFADDETRPLMEQQAERIDRVRREGVELSSGTEYDIYLCAREVDENGRRVMDSVIAAGLYSRLNAEGFRVFSPQKSLEDKSGGEWEPYIFAVLASARVMIVVGTSAESFEDVWVRNAWSRFSELSGKTIIPVLRDMPPSELPAELSKLQALDMSRLGAESDLISAIKAVTGEMTAAVRDVYDDHENDPMIRRAELFLEDGDFERANEISAQLLSKSPNNARAYVIRLLAEYRLKNENELDDMTENFTDSENYRLAMRYGSEPLRAGLKEHSNRSLYKKFTARLNNAVDERECLAAAADLRTLGNYSDAAELAENAEKKVAELREKAEIKRREGVYELAAKAVSESADAAVLRSAEHSLRALGDYKDAPELAEKCAVKIAELPAMQTVTFVDEPNRRKKYLPFAAGGAVLLAAAVIIIISANVSRKPAIIDDVSTQSTVSVNSTYDSLSQEKAEKYAKAAASLENGDYSEAELIFTALGDYKDSAKMVSECKYRSASAMLENGEYDMAERAFERLDGYSDSRGMIYRCRYQKAQQLLENGDTAAARLIFEELDGRWECEEFLKQIEYIEAERLLDAGKYKEARDAFEAIWQYSDSLRRFYESRYKYASELFENGEYYTASSEFYELIGYEDSETQYRRACYYHGLELEENGNLEKACLYLKIAKGYEDASEQLTRVRNKYIRTKPFDFEFGRYYDYDQKYISALRWEVMDIQGDMAFVRTDIIDYQPFDDNDPDCTWENSALREWLNGGFYEDVFNAGEKAQILTSVFETGSGEYNYIGTSGSGISDKIFLLNTSEAKNTPYYGDINDKTHLSIYAQQKLPKDYGQLFCWGRDRPLTQFYDDWGKELPPDVDATTQNCIMIGMWIYIGD
ncbi:MAG: TIR domain-containing protein [Ruminococcaceae bacterium]|nr:TIR domain-containing protein [Oscillospiraceae bacterium]